MSPERRPELSGLPQMRPMIPAVGNNPKDLTKWVAEVKWDGIRGIIYVPKNAPVFIQSKNDKNVAWCFPELSLVFQKLGEKHELIIDGEITFGEGKNSLERQQVTNRFLMTENEAVGSALDNPCTFRAFDLMFLDGEDLRHHPLEVRRSKLEEILAPITGPFVQLTEYSHDLAKTIDEAQSEGYEGIILKLTGSHYYATGRANRNWLKRRFARAA